MAFARPPSREKKNERPGLRELTCSVEEQASRRCTPIREKNGSESRVEG
jgi:hypothetical protein